MLLFGKIENNKPSVFIYLDKTKVMKVNNRNKRIFGTIAIIVSTGFLLIFCARLYYSNKYENLVEELYIERPKYESYWEKQCTIGDSKNHPFKSDIILYQKLWTASVEKEIFDIEFFLREYPFLKSTSLHFIHGAKE